MGGRLLKAAVLAGALAAVGPCAAAQPAPAAAGRPAPVLRRIVFLPDVADVQITGATAEGPALDAARVPTLSAPSAQAVFRPLLGRPLDGALVGEVRAGVSAYYARIGRPFMATALPKQDVTDGVLQIVVIEARLGKVEVEGARWFGEGVYRRRLHLTPGGPIDGTQLQADLDWLNRNPYRHATAVAEAGEAPGTTDLVVRADERRPLAFNLGVDNTGTKSTGLTRVTAGVDWGNAFWRGDGLNYQFSASPGSSALRQHSLSYTTDLPWRHSLNLSASYSKSHSIDEADFGSEGITKIATARYAIPLPRRGRLTHNVGLGFDFKSSNSDILFGGESVFPTTTEVDQFLLEYVGQAPDRAGSTTFSLSLIASPGGMTPRNDDAHFDAQQAGARARYGYARASVSRYAGLTQQLSWSGRVSGQLAGGTLLPSEQIAFGGASSVRGMIEQGATRDSGLVWQNELRGPELPIGPKTSPFSISPFWFLDAGFGQNHHDAPGVKSWMALVTTGPGANLQLGRHLGGRLTFGTPLVRKGSTGRTLALQFALQAVF